MEAVKDTVTNLVSGTTAKNESTSQFAAGHRVPVSHQSSTPGKQHDMPGQAPVNDMLPSDDGGYAPYKFCGKLAGKKALITGGDSGIGRAIAILYALEGAESVIVYLPEEERDAQETKRLVEEKGGKTHLVTADLRSQAACLNVVEKAKELMGRVGILVLNHATQNMVEKIEDLSEEQWLNTFNTNIHPFFFLAKYTLPQMKSGDTVITCASVNPYVGRPDLLDYTSSKGAIVAFTRGLANMYVDKGIRVNAVCPGPVWTPLIPTTMSAEAQKEFTSPMGRPGQPSEIATCFVFLASNDSSMISGQSLHPNGGTQVGS